MFEMPAFESQAAREHFQALKLQAAANPQDVKTQLRLVDAHRRSGMPNLAKKELKNATPVPTEPPVPRMLRPFLPSRTYFAGSHRPIARALWSIRGKRAARRH